MDLELICTDLKSVTKKYVWVVQNYSNIKKKEPSLSLSNLGFPLPNGTKVEFTLSANSGCANHPNNCVCVGLTFNSHLTNVCAKMKVTAKNDVIEKWHPNMNHVPFIVKSSLENESNTLLPNDTLTLVFEVTVFGDVKSTLFFDKRDEEIGKHNFSFYLTLNNNYPKLSDITIYVKEQKFLAHKVILAARSPVFAAMFEHDMQETKNNRLDIIDMDPQVVEEMLRFIYTGDVLNLNKMAVDLLSASDKYGLESLKCICEHAMYLKLTIANAVDTLLLADLHNTKQLKNAVMSFIVAHAEEVRATAGWVKMTQPLINDLFYTLTSPASTAKN